MKAMRWAMAGMLLAGGAAGSAGAQTAPRVVADIPPVQSLAAMAMAGVGEVELIVPPGASPHGFTLRPSQAGALERADLVISIGPALAPWLDEAADALARPEAVRLDLLDLPGTHALPFREAAVFAGGHDHDDDHAAHDEDGHDDHDPADAAHAGEHEGEGHDDAGHDGHDHHGLDPHAWLNPDNALVWLDAIADALARIDPARAETYAANAAAGRARIEAAARTAEELLEPVHHRPYVVFHDAYRHFEERFDMPASAAVSLGDAASPGARRVAEVREAIETTRALCVFAEPQMPARLIDSVAGDEVRRGVLDPLGATLTPGPELYPALIEAMAKSLLECLGDRA
ncbi:zinc ABC transporter substrate-binding protein [Albimonas sp. CAU 1670]|uniref:zinc ABC transporter substrate-binding protein n=1 Tax=Albimonas sp. CAU 1670 TaxID=3032599 RepID=UPI0023DCD49E|nr:zinc ABC transporter substrate-binding protein [Albimonas sp. CAU 1670]MDF2231968.1 zinc ABC transporter substrate-binding protein [Albimonas sp. CAU 1670]